MLHACNPRGVDITKIQELIGSGYFRSLLGAVRRSTAFHVPCPSYPRFALFRKTTIRSEEVSCLMVLAGDEMKVMAEEYERQLP